jgi:prophage maintenance system killer protein/prophage antirepressor-like protein
MKPREIVIFKSKTGDVKLNADFRGDTIWATQAQIAELFQIDRTRITRHINNILADDEVDRKSNVRKTHFANSDKPVNLYSLDMILSVGYRTNSAKAIEFRKWANVILKDYLLRGVAINQKRLDELNQVLEIISRSEIDEVSGVADVLKNYTAALHILADYDENKLSRPHGQKAKWELTYAEARKLLDSIDFAANSANFARERSQSFQGILQSIYQTFAGEELYPSVQEKAANLLYLVVKDHPFFDGNKRSAAALFVYFLEKNGALRDKNGRQIIASNALAAITLMTALSKPVEKEQIVLLVMNLIDSGKMK